ncbi:MAG: 4Fe-4S binding protein, partial [Bacillota bacterium]
LDKIKYLIWVPWLLGIVGLFVAAGGARAVSPLFMTETGVSVDEPLKYITYYLVVAVFVGLAMIAGRRATCHTICWMAPFMVIGSRVRRLGLWPSLHLVADQSRCSGCTQCNQHCVMGLDVNRMVKQSDMRNDECILCGECVDHCPRSAIHYTVSRSVRLIQDQATTSQQGLAK